MTWPTKKLGEVCTVLSGFGFPKDLQGRTSGDFPFFKVSDMNSRGNEDEMKIANHWIMKADVKRKGYKIAPTGTIIFPKIGGAISTNKKRKLIRGSIYDNNVMGLIPNGKILPDFLFWWLKGFDITEWASDSALPSMKKTTIEETEIPLPPIGEQRRIVEKIEKLFAKIDEASRLRAESSTASAALLPSALHQIFSRAEKEGWEEKTLPEISENLDAKRDPIKKSLRKKGEYPYYGASGIVDYVKDYIFDQNLLLISEDGANLVARTTPIAFSISGKAWVNNHAHILSFTDFYTQRFTEFYFNSIDLKLYISGMAQPKLNQDRMNQIKIPLPPIAEQKKIVARLDSLSEKIGKIKNLQSATQNDFTALEQSILSKSFSR